MASPEVKKRCIAGDGDFEVSLSDFPECLRKPLTRTLQKILVWGVPDVTPLKILNCNAADVNSGISFSKAYCSIADESKKRFAFSDLFDKGTGILLALIEKRELPKSRAERFVLQKLLNYLCKKADNFPGKSLENLKVTELTTILANHLFGELATSSNYIIDKHYAGKNGNRCLCGKSDCKLSGSFGDTSIGHEEVWHGNLDIIVNNDLLVDTVDPDTSKTQDDGPGGKSPVNVKLKTADLIRNPQIIAETIVFSFIQKHQHPESEHFLIPCIGVGPSHLVVMFYDPKHDVLLESCPIPLLEAQVKGCERFPPKINRTLVVVSWLVVNYKFLSSGLPDIAQKYKADFCTVAKNKIEVYENQLKFGNVGISYVHGIDEDKLHRPRSEKIKEQVRRMNDIYLSLSDSD